MGLLTGLGLKWRGRGEGEGRDENFSGQARPFSSGISSIPAIQSGCKLVSIQHENAWSLFPDIKRSVAV